MDKINRNRKYFDNCIQTAYCLFDKKEYETTARFIYKMAHYVWGNYSGYYASWRLESILNKIGHTIPDNELLIPSKTRARRKVLHVASELYNVGGHTRLMLNWIQNDKNSDHQILVIRQDVSQLPEEVLAEYQLNTNDILLLGDESLIHKAAKLRKLAYDYDFVVLHTHPDEVISVIAFSCKNVPPVLFMNHADHIFWMGVSVLDILIQLREPVIEQDKKRRNISSPQFFQPIPVGVQKFDVSQSEVREKLGINPGVFMILSTGSDYKYTPYKDHNFFKSVRDLVEKLPQCEVYIAGVSPSNKYALKFAHERVHCLDHITNLHLYESACDLYLEGFPAPSFTALLQPVLRGKPAYLMYNPVGAAKMFPENVQGFQYPANEEYWMNGLIDLVNHREKLISLQKQQEKYAKHFSIEGWKEQLSHIYNAVEQIQHTVKGEKKDVLQLGVDEECLSNIDLNHKIGHMVDIDGLDKEEKEKHKSYLMDKPGNVVIRKPQRVSVIVPNYNHSLYLSRRIDSILNQHYQEFELILLDDCSTDNSVEVMMKYKDNEKVSDIIINEKNSGSTFKQWRKGIEAASGEYIWIAESDDSCHPYLLAKAVEILDKRSNVGLVYCQSLRINENDEVLGNWKFHTRHLDKELWENDFFYDGVSFVKKFLLYANVIPNASAVLFRKDVCDKIGGPDTSFKMNGDWMFYSNMLSISDIAFISEPYNHFREHSNKGTSKNVYKYNSLKELYRIIRELEKNFDIDQKDMAKVKDGARELWFNQKAVNKKHLLYYKLLNVLPEATRTDPMFPIKIMKVYFNEMRRRYMKG